MSGTGQPFPSDPILERKVIEGLVNLPADFAEALDLSAECFYDPTHRRLFEACKALHGQKRVVDQLLVLSQFPQDAEMRPFVAHLGFPSDRNLPEWCQSLRNLRSVRRTIEAGLKAAALGFDSGRSPGAYLDEASKMFSEALNTRPGSGQLLTASEMMDGLMADLSSGRGKDFSKNFTTGFRQLDFALWGLEPGKVYVVAGRTGMGKSALANHIALNVASLGRRVLAFNLEMTPSELGRRMASITSRVDSRRIKSGDLDDLAAKRVTKAAELIAPFPLEFPRCTDITIEELRRLARSRMPEGLQMVVVDYLQQVKTSERIDSREQVVATVSRGLKQMALELNVPVIAVAQLNREAEKRSGARPGLADLRESGAIEQDADVVLLLYRDEYYNAATKEPGIAEVIVAKNRDGETGIIKMAFEKQCTRFHDLAVANG